MALSLLAAATTHSSRLICLVDSAELPSAAIQFQLVLNFQSAKKIHDVVVVHAERPATYFNSLSPVTLIDCYSDPLGWNASETSLPINNLKKLTERLATLQNESTALVFDGIGPFLTHTPVNEFCIFLRSLSKRFGSVLFSLHQDTVSEATISTFSHISLSVISTIRVPVNILSHVDGSFEIIQKGRNEKVIFTRQHYTCTGQRIKTIADDKVERKSEKMMKDYLMEAKSTSSKTPGSSFNLGTSLSQTEKEAKENVVLPFTKKGRGATESASTLIFLDEDDDAFDEFEDDLDADVEL